MKRATLYLLVGYPGAGKTTASQMLHELTGAVHLWVDYERQAMFGTPTYSQAENRELYDHLNKTTEILLSEGQSVIFDTNFNFRKDRELLRDMADKYQAETVLIWVKVAKSIARKRATTESKDAPTRLFGDMPAPTFERIASHLEPPAAEEQPVIFDGTKITPAYVAGQLGLKKPKRASAPTESRHDA